MSTQRASSKQRRAVRALAPVLEQVEGRLLLASSITVTSPNTRIVWDPGSGYNKSIDITWKSSGVQGDVKIDLSTDNGSSWINLIPKTANDGKEAWTWTKDVAATPNALVRVTSISDTKVSDQSDNSFTVWGRYYKGFYGGYCTEYAAREFDAVAGGKGVTWSGNAGAWYSSASGTYEETTDTKSGVNGAIAVWKNYYKDKNGNTVEGFGHVAVVRGYKKDAKGNITHLIVDEQNFGATMLDANNAITSEFGGAAEHRELPIASLDRGSYKFQGFVLPQKK